MRLDIVLICTLFAASPALGHGHGIPVPKPLPQSHGHVTLDLSNLHLHLFHEPSADEANGAATTSPGEAWSQQKSASDIAMGSLHAHFGADDNPRANLSIYQMQGADQLGNSIWHSQQGRSAKLLFVWPTQQ